jgi:hypothetical protein
MQKALSLKEKLDIVVHTCNPSYSQDGGRRDHSPRIALAKVQDLI